MFSEFGQKYLNGGSTFNEGFAVNNTEDEMIFFNSHVKFRGVRLQKFYAWLAMDRTIFLLLLQEDENAKYEKLLLIWLLKEILSCVCLYLLLFQKAQANCESCKRIYWVSVRAVAAQNQKSGGGPTVTHWCNQKFLFLEPKEKTWEGVPQNILKIHIWNPWIWCIYYKIILQIQWYHHHND